MQPRPDEVIQVPLPQHVEDLQHALKAIGASLEALQPMAPDASTRRFYRLRLTDRSSLVACVYPPGDEMRRQHDWEVQLWARQRGLPVPAPVVTTSRVIVMADLGRLNLEVILQQHRDEILPLVLECLGKFQVCQPEGAPNTPFDAAFFRRELNGFLAQADASVGGACEVETFFDGLTKSLASHPYRLTHRDFHANNLLFHGGKVWAVDFQDMRAGPDTYDLVSFLRERAGGERIVEERRWGGEAAARLRWEEGWWQRYLECACQRGLKVLGTFLRLAKEGKVSYLRHVPAVASRAEEALVALGAPAVLVDEVARLRWTEAYNRCGEEP